LVSVNVGLPKNLPWQGKNVYTGVFKDPVSGLRRVGKLPGEIEGIGPAGSSTLADLLSWGAAGGWELD
jgi:hypothetical protein